MADVCFFVMVVNLLMVCFGVGFVPCWFVGLFVLLLFLICLGVGLLVGGLALFIVCVCCWWVLLCFVCGWVSFSWCLWLISLGFAVCVDGCVWCLDG